MKVIAPGSEVSIRVRGKDPILGTVDSVNIDRNNCASYRVAYWLKDTFHTDYFTEYDFLTPIPDKKTLGFKSTGVSNG